MSEHGTTYYLMCIEKDGTIHIFDNNGFFKSKHYMILPEEIKKVKFKLQIFNALLISFCLGTLAAIGAMARFFVLRHSSTFTLLQLLFTLIFMLIYIILFGNKKIVIKTTYHATFTFNTSKFLTPKSSKNYRTTILLEKYFLNYKNRK